MKRLLWGIALLACSACPPAAVEVVHEERPADYSAFWPAKLCVNCHEKLVTQHGYSAHAAAFVNPVFQALLYEQLVPRIGSHPHLDKEASSCLACHSPIVWLQSGGKLVPPEQVDLGYAGVTCDFCHTIRGYKGKVPGNANYISTPGETKFGPYKIGGDWHHAYSELVTKSEFCAICHSTTNFHGLKLRTTYEEWKESDYAKKGVQCQDCHMSAKGYLVDGKPVFDSGPIARLGSGFTPRVERQAVHNHRFPGAHSEQQLTGALQVKVVPYPRPLKRGETIQLAIDVVNTNVGHRMPSGSVELRNAWLEVRVALSDEDPGTVLKALPKDAKRPLDVAGLSELEGQLLRGDAPAGSRVYRAVLLDEAGQPTLLNYEAFTLHFDNRLQAGEVRREVYDFVVPDQLEDDNDLHVTATLKYLRYPSLFADLLQVEHARAVQLAVGRGLLGQAEEKDQR